MALRPGQGQGQGLTSLLVGKMRKHVVLNLRTRYAEYAGAYTFKGNFEFYHLQFAEIGVRHKVLIASTPNADQCTVKPPPVTIHCSNGMTL